MATVTLSEADFSTNEQAYSLFEMNEALGVQNHIFIAMKDTTKEGLSYGVAGGISGGVGQLAGNLIDKNLSAKDALNNLIYDGLLINDTEAGFGIIPLVNKGVALTFNPAKMTAKPNRYFLVPRDEIEEVVFKNFSFLTSKVKRFVIKLKDGTKFSLQVRAQEKTVPYQASAVEKMTEKYGKKK